MIRKAEIHDLDAIVSIYDAVHTAEEQGILTIGWDRAIYPIRQTAVDALARGDLFVEEQDGKIVASGILNQIQVPIYSECPWQYAAEDSEVMVLHTLVVHPQENGKGYAKEFVRFYEDYAKQHGCHCLRIDTQDKNSGARKMYAGMGFHEAAVLDCEFNGLQGIKLVCIEKRI